MVRFGKQPHTRSQNTNLQFSSEQCWLLIVFSFYVEDPRKIYLNSTFTCKFFFFSNQSYIFFSFIFFQHVYNFYSRFSILKGIEKIKLNGQHSVVFPSGTPQWSHSFMFANKNLQKTRTANSSSTCSVVAVGRWVRMGGNWK